MTLKVCEKTTRKKKMGKATKALEFDIFFGGSKIAFLSHFNTKKCYFYLWMAKKKNAIKLQDS